MEKLVLRQTLSRELEKYRSPSPAGLAASQLADVGKNLRPGQSVRFIHTLGEPGGRAWDLEGTVETVLKPFKMDKQASDQPIPLPMFAATSHELVPA